MILIAMIYILSGDLHAIKVVRAGDVGKNVFAVKIIDAPKRTSVRSNNAIEDITNMKTMFVKGNSMRDYHIMDGQTIYVETFINEEQKEHINTYPVLVLELQKKNILLRLFVSQFKLRKFICYIDNIDDVDWGVIFDNHNDGMRRIKLTRQEFIRVIHRKIEEMKQRKEYIENCKYTLSETFDEDKNCYSYSLHQVTKIFGKVRYAA